MKFRTSLVGLVSPLVLVGLFAGGCGDSGHGPGQTDGGNGGGGQTGTGGGSGGAGGTIGTGGAIGTGGIVGPGGHGGTGGSAGHGGGGVASGGSGTGGAGHGGSGGSATGGSGGSGTGGAGHGGSGGSARGGSGGSATGGAGGKASGGAGGNASGGAGGQGGAMVCSSLPLVACSASEVCDYDTPGRCGAGSEPGHCIVLPGGCTTDYVPVCGCDGHTYGNDCSRKMARVQLDHTGACAGGAGGAGGGGAGAFNCGGVLTCDATRTYCYSYVGGIGTPTTMYSCEPSPTSCTSAPTCSCVCPASSAGCTQSPTCTCTNVNGLTKLDCFGG